jgi:hypothetical protein
LVFIGAELEGGIETTACLLLEMESNRIGQIVGYFRERKKGEISFQFSTHGEDIKYFVAYYDLG